MKGKTIKQIADELCVSKQAIWQRVKRSEELSAMLSNHSRTVNGTIYVDTDLECRIKEQYPNRSTIDGTGVNIDGITVNMSEHVDGTGVNIDGATVNMSEHVDGTGVNVDGATVNMSEHVDGTGVNVDGITVNMSEHVDGTGVNVDGATVNMSEHVDGAGVNTLIETLQKTVDMLQQQLTVKDKQIDELTVMLKSSQEQQAMLVTALSAAQALHAGTIQERLTERSGASEWQDDEGTIKEETLSDPDEGETKREPLQEKQGFFARIFGKHKKG